MPSFLSVVYPARPGEEVTGIEEEFTEDGSAVFRFAVGERSYALTLRENAISLS